MTEKAESAAFTRLYSEFFDPIFGYCRRRLGDIQAAEDATSTVFSLALAAGPRYNDPSLRSWLFGIAHNVVVNRYRAVRSEATLDEAVEVAATQPTLDDLVAANEDHDLLLRALSVLPKDQRLVVELRMAGLTGPEIAGVLERSHGSVKMLQLRAFTRLREVLAEHAQETNSHE